MRRAVEVEVEVELRLRLMSLEWLRRKIDDGSAAAGRLRSYSNSLLSTKRLPYSVLRTDTADR